MNQLGFLYLILQCDGDQFCCDRLPFEKQATRTQFHFTDNSRQLGKTCLDSWGGERLIKNVVREFL